MTRAEKMRLIAMDSENEDERLGYIVDNLIFPAANNGEYYIMLSREWVKKQFGFDLPIRALKKEGFKLTYSSSTDTICISWDKEDD